MALRNILIVILSCFFLNPAAQNRFLTGIVRMEGRPVTGLIVYTPFATAKTDNLGRYSLSLAGCLACRPGYVLTIYTANANFGSTEQLCTINNDYRCDFSIARSRIIVNGMVRSSGINAGPLRGIEVKVMAGDTGIVPVITDDFGEFKIPIFSALHQSTNTVRLQARDPNGLYRPVRVETDLYNINAFNIITMEPSNSVFVQVNGFTRTSVCVRKGNLVTFEADGHIRVGAMVGTSDPDGRNAGIFGMSIESYNIVSTIAHAALMYRLEGEKEWQFAGKRKGFTADKDGCIEFQINDNIQDDNVGSYSVSITVQHG